MREDENTRRGRCLLFIKEGTLDALDEKTEVAAMLSAFQLSLYPSSGNSRIQCSVLGGHAAAAATAAAPAARAAPFVAAD